MKKISKGLYLLLAVIVCLTIVQPVNAKTKYTKADKNLSYTLAVFQDSELLNPDSFKIKKISKVKYVLNKDNFEVYAACGILDGYRTITWKVDYTASNAYGGKVYMLLLHGIIAVNTILILKIILTKLAMLKATRVSHLLKKSRSLRQNTIRNFKEV